MGRWSHLDTDSERLPPGFTRAGYDADTGIYSYQDEDGNCWEGMPGRQYGPLRRVKLDNEDSEYDDAFGQDLDLHSGAIEEQNKGRRQSMGRREKKQVRGRAGTLSSLASYFGFHNGETETTRNGNASDKQRDEDGKMAPLKRAVTFDEILAGSLHK